MSRIPLPTTLVSVPEKVIGRSQWDRLWGTKRRNRISPVPKDGMYEIPGSTPRKLFKPLVFKDETLLSVKVLHGYGPILWTGLHFVHPKKLLVTFTMCNWGATGTFGFKYPEKLLVTCTRWRNHDSNWFCFSTLKSYWSLVRKPVHMKTIYQSFSTLKSYWSHSRQKFFESYGDT